MPSNLGGDCRNFVWLLWQATLSYRAIIPVILLSGWCLFDAQKNRRSLFILALPVFWLSPMLLAGAFTDWSSAEAKTAQWVGSAALLAFALQIIFSVYLIKTMNGRRWLAVIGGLLNGVIGLLALFVVGMDGSCDWI